VLNSLDNSELEIPTATAPLFFYVLQIIYIQNMETINWDDFCKIDLRTGTITAVEEFKEARNPAYKLLIDFGELGIKKSSAQITTLYQPEDLIGTQIIAVVNFPKKQIGTFMSECLVLGIQEQANVVLITTERMAKNGVKIS